MHFCIKHNEDLFEYVVLHFIFIFLFIRCMQNIPVSNRFLIFEKERWKLIYEIILKPLRSDFTSRITVTSVAFKSIRPTYDAMWRGLVNDKCQHDRIKQRNFRLAESRETKYPGSFQIKWKIVYEFPEEKLIYDSNKCNLSKSKNLVKADGTISLVWRQVNFIETFYLIIASL